MGGSYPLSPSQREAMNHFGEINEGNLLAVSGPPGTGKTTFLQSVVADMYVKSALQKEKAPIIVAASTNNQAVTNIIDSFGQISEIGISNLEHKWITGTNSFAVYFPSNGEVKEAIKNDINIRRYVEVDLQRNLSQQKTDVPQEGYLNKNSINIFEAK